MYNEEEGTDLFFGRLTPVLEAITPDYEIVCVDDGSSDRTLVSLMGHHARDPRIKVLSLSRNFGKDTALSAGLDYCKGLAVIPIDADLQDPPELIGQMVEKWREGYEVVYARRAARDTDDMQKRVSAGLFYRIHNWIADVKIPDNVGDFRLMDRRVVEALKHLPEKTRFMKGLFAWVGFKQIGIDYAREARAAGTTKWRSWKLWNFAIDGITGSHLDLFWRGPWHVCHALCLLAADSHDDLRQSRARLCLLDDRRLDAGFHQHRRHRRAR
jgi:glycosyltransferase involved in cell wall biosynthesis